MDTQSETEVASLGGTQDHPRLQREVYEHITRAPARRRARANPPGEKKPAYSTAPTPWPDHWAFKNQACPPGGHLLPGPRQDHRLSVREGTKRMGTEPATAEGTVSRGGQHGQVGGDLSRVPSGPANSSTKQSLHIQ